jgi:hypothetical protein
LTDPPRHCDTGSDETIHLSSLLFRTKDGLLHFVANAVGVSNEPEPALLDGVGKVT